MMYVVIALLVLNTAATAAVLYRFSDQNTRLLAALLHTRNHPSAARAILTEPDSDPLDDAAERYDPFTDVGLSPKG